MTLPRLALVATLTLLVPAAARTTPADAAARTPQASPMTNTTNRTNVTTTNAVADKTTLLNDVYLAQRTDAGEVVFGNAKLALTFGKKRGDWRAFTAEGVSGNLLAPAGENTPPLTDVRVNGEPVLEKRGAAAAALAGYETSLDRTAESVTLRLSYQAGDDYELACTYTLFPGQARLDRAARLVRKGGQGSQGEAAKLENFTFRFPGLALGDPADCRVSVPGPWWPKTYFAPNTPYAQLAADPERKTTGFHGAPDAGFGLVTITNPAAGKTLAAWMDTAGGEANYRPSLSSDGARLTLAFTNNRLYRLLPGQAVESDVQRLEIVDGALPAALARYRENVARTMPLDARTPAWVREAVILEVYPDYYKEGFKGITAKLPFYKDIGFNVVYLMPHWQGGYSPLDPAAVEPKYGTPDDLKALVREAHRLGMKVLFDMVIHGFQKSSPILKSRPDLFIHDEQGNIVPHPTWGSMSTDWAAPAYRKYMVDLVLHDLREYDIDGYRVDAASYKGASWDAKSPRPAYESGSAAPAVMRAMLGALREKKPDAVLLSEVFGPVFYSVCNFGHDNQAEAVPFFLEQMDEGRATARDYKEHLAQVFDLLPAGANRVIYARNHDASWFYRFGGYTPRFLALDAIHALVALPEIFAGDPKHGPNPDDDPATYAFYKRVFALRRELPELARGDVNLRGVSCDNPQVFTALRTLNGHTTLIAVSLSDKPETATITLPAGSGQQLRLRDAQTGQSVEAAGGRLTLKPFQVLAGRLTSR